eukprot:CAMPEP_0179137702 /NCGR_PEP_ID=MMETSP0796-20121207/65707_1 /TAXON_ID=73915 /ORGANISM="Pyrodinium bahamense, Strain pbaha01" /LENGTH=77 /DNA_ID=CAMNT_0020836903 /DNA_START=142 /DNA_END=372 /DNA_ORIENTATION=+
MSRAVQSTLLPGTCRADGPADAPQAQMARRSPLAWSAAGGGIHQDRAPVCFAVVQCRNLRPRAWELTWPSIVTISSK